MKSKLIRIMPFIVILAFLLIVAHQLTASDQDKPTKHPEADFSISCVECHTETTPDIVEEWKSSKHGMMNFACYMCHGDGVEEFWPKPSTDRCTSCHSAQTVEWDKAPVKNCFDCHKGHTLKFHTQ